MFGQLRKLSLYLHHERQLIPFIMLVKTNKLQMYKFFSKIMYKLFFIVLLRVPNGSIIKPLTKRIGNCLGHATWEKEMGIICL